MMEWRVKHDCTNRSDSMPDQDQRSFAPLAPRASVPTLEEVAAFAKVSRSTASRVINGSSHVTAEAVAAVTLAVEALGYVPNRAARTLVSRRTHAIALVVPESTARVFEDPFFASVIQGVALHVAATEYTMNLLIASESRPEKTHRFLTAGNVDGVLVVSHHSGDHSYSHLGSLPVVFGGRPTLTSPEAPYVVDSDNRGGAAAAVRHLHASGRRRLAIIAGPSDMTPGRDRLEGAMAAAAEVGAQVVAVEPGDFTTASGSRAAQRLLDSGVAFDGVFASNDQMAAAALSEFGRAGLDVPGDVAVMGFDDSYFARASSPRLSTMRQDPHVLGSRMTSVLIDLIEGRPVDRVTILPTELVVRASTATPALHHTDAA
jgi:DNA-binding LacI/PurR family transcriptional regulator